jgi:hypothetical protein
MPKRFVPTTRWTRWAAAACLVAATLVVFQLWRSDPPTGPAPAQPSSTEAAVSGGGEETAAFSLRPSEDYVEIVERPLFSRSRRPAPPEETKPGVGAGGVEDGTAARIALNGIILTGKRRVALLRFDNDPKVIHVSEGQEAGGWLIEKINADRVVVRRGQQESEIVLDYKKNANQQAAVPVPLTSADTMAAPSEEEEQPD